MDKASKEDFDRAGLAAWLALNCNMTFLKAMKRVAIQIIEKQNGTNKTGNRKV
ncbi:MAG: hypothetical protein ACYC2P_08780 [Paludibacteraceae bacterium]